MFADCQFFIPNKNCCSTCTFPSAPEQMVEGRALSGCFGLLPQTGPFLLLGGDSGGGVGVGATLAFTCPGQFISQRLSEWPGLLQHCNSFLPLPAPLKPSVATLTLPRLTFPKVEDHRPFPSPPTLSSSFLARKNSSTKPLSPEISSEVTC